MKSRKVDEFQKHLAELDEEISITAGKPLDQLTDEEKQAVVMRWAMARGRKPEKKGVLYYIFYFLTAAVSLVFLSCLALLVLRWFFTIIGVI